MALFPWFHPGTYWLYQCADVASQQADVASPYADKARPLTKKTQSRTVNRAT